ncbi:putative Helicase ATP-binding domain-containing protein [Seiridium unicorne]|uniref:Helicase ATP-binding domain-containing protein n=1 Tax=Seiridium unicorne TaxID=138068 RepID=A0ABR2UHQ6_9PEZI
MEDSGKPEHPAKRQRLEECEKQTEPGREFTQPSTRQRTFWDDVLQDPVSVEFQGYTTTQSQTLENICAEESLDSSEHELCCFGMIPGITGYFECLTTTDIPSLFTVQLKSAKEFTSEELGITGHVNTEHGTMIQGLLDVPEISTKLSCLPTMTALRKKPKSFGRERCDLELTIFGIPELFDEIGRWLQDFDAYLQDPRTIGDRPNLLDTLSYCIDLEEAPQPRVIKSKLKIHQKQALHFMICREQGWRKKHNIPDLWDRVDTDRGRIYVNTVTNVYQNNTPQQTLGGIIADPMGLGKTLTMIALIAADLERGSEEDLDEDDEILATRNISATLVIVPPPLISAWEEQLSDHLVDGELPYSRYDGYPTPPGSILPTDRLVLTTYHTVSAEWKKGTSSDDSVLFSVRWKRIVLDEAHFIRNGNSRMARAICALQSQTRWAVTGTPIQNRLGDLMSLLKFIRAHPYADPKQFDTDISQLWRSGKDEEAVKRLRRLSSCLLLRRPKTTIALPERTDLECPVDFNTDEREAYKQIHQQAIVKIDEILRNENVAFKSNVFVNVLQQIEALRLFCSLGLKYYTRHQAHGGSSIQSDDWSKIAQSVFNSQRQMGSGDGDPLLQGGQFSRCLKFLCGECTQKSKSVMRCGHRQHCPTTTVTTDSNAFEETDGVNLRDLGSSHLPSKIKALVADIQSLPANTKCIVFSTWRLTLDVVEAALNEASLPSLRFDGKLPQKDRQSVISRFRDGSIRVMLLTLSCGAVGLTLTAASRAYLLEPHWNPTLEEQALARIHRLGQTQEVTTVRLYVRDSFEELIWN